MLVPELNLGQLRMLVRAKYLVDAMGLNKVQGRPFAVAEVMAKIKEMLAGRHTTSSPTQAGTDLVNV